MSERPTKRTKLSYSKCAQCRKDRQACRPEDRRWPARCERCEKYNYKCSKSRTRAEEAQEQAKAEEAGTLTGSDVEPLKFVSTEECVQDIGHLRKLLETVEILMVNNCEYDDHLAIIYEEIEASLEDACNTGRTKVKCLISQKDYASASLVQSIIVDGFVTSSIRSLEDQELCAEISCARGDISGALDIRWDILYSLMESGDASNKEVLGALGGILKLARISRSQITHVAERHGIDIAMCRQLNQPLYRAINFISTREGDQAANETVIKSFLEDQTIEERLAWEAISPIRLAMQRKDAVSTASLVKNGIGLDFLSFWRPSFDFSRPKLSDKLPPASLYPSSIIRGSVLHHAVAFGTEDILKALLNYGIDTSQKDENGRTPLHLAVLCGKKEMIRLLLSEKAPVNSEDFRRYNAYENLLDYLEFSCLDPASMMEMALEMVDKGADIEKVSCEDHTLLMLAINSVSCDESDVEEILSRGASIHNEENRSSPRDPLIMAAAQGYAKKVKVILDHDIQTYGLMDTNLNTHWKKLREANERRGLGSYTISGMEDTWFSAAREAAANGHEKMVQLFLDYGIPVDFPDPFGITLLLQTIAAKEENLSLLSLLLSKGAAVNVKTTIEETPLRLAICHGREVTAHLLIVHGADVNMTNSQGQNPLHLATKCPPGFPPTTSSMIEKLLSHGCHFNLPDNKKETALHLAARYGDWSLIKPLLKAHKKSRYPIELKNHADRTPLDMCQDALTKAKFQKWLIKNGFTPFVDLIELSESDSDSDSNTLSSESDSNSDTLSSDSMIS